LCADDGDIIGRLFSGAIVPGVGFCTVPPPFVIPDDGDLFSLCTAKMQKKIKDRAGTRGTDGEADANNDPNIGDISNVLLAFVNPTWTAVSALYSSLTADEAKKQYASDTYAKEAAANKAVSNAVKSAQVDSADDGKALGYTVIAMAGINRLQLVSGAPLDYLTMQLKYDMQYMSPQMIPDQSDIDALRISHKISDDTWTCLTRYQGNKPGWFKPLLKLKETKPNPNELVSLYRRNAAPDLTQLTYRMKEVGVPNDNVINEYITLSEQVPQAPDIVRFMVRDVFDPDTVKKYGLDDEFTDKYTDKAKQLGFAAGLSDDTARYEWMSHWKVPSDTSLYTMVHYLNPNRPEVVEWDKATDNGTNTEAVNIIGDRPPTFTEDDLRYALKVNDNLPTFVDKLVAIQYRPITNTDAARMHELGYIDDDQLKWAFVKNGYTEADSTQLVGFYKAQQSKRLSNDTGIWTGRKILAMYKQGIINEDTADNMLSLKFVNPAIRSSILDAANSERAAEVKLTQMKSLKNKFLFGYYDEEDLGDRLDALGIDTPKKLQLMDEWIAQRDGRMKEPKVAMLCEWFTNGFITYDNYFNRLRNLGYTIEDAQNIAQTCAAANNLKQQKAAAAQAEKQRKATEQAIRDAKNDVSRNLRNALERIKILEAENKAIRMGVSPDLLPPVV
jgi:hypothetical protein